MHIADCSVSHRPSYFVEGGSVEQRIRTSLGLDMAQVLFMHAQGCFAQVFWPRLDRYNDLALAERHFDRAKSYIDHLGRHIDPKTHVLPVDWGGTLLGDWCAGLGVNGTGAGQHGVDGFTSRHTSGVYNTFYYVRM
jgi:hypothetical protein